MKWKALLAGVFVFSLMGGSTMFADSAPEKITVLINGHEVEGGGYVIDGRTYISIRDLNGVISYNGNDNKVQILKPNVHIFLFKGDSVFGNVNKGKLKFNVFSQVDSLEEDVSSVKVAITDPSGNTKDIQSQDLDGKQKDNFWFRTYDFTYDFKTAGKYKVGFYIKSSKNSDYTLVSEKVITALD